MEIMRGNGTRNRQYIHHRHRYVYLGVTIALLFICLAIVVAMFAFSPVPAPFPFPVPFPVRVPPSASHSYAVVVVADSSRSCLFIFCFDSNTELLPIGNDAEHFAEDLLYFNSTKVYLGKKPELVADYLIGLLREAESVVPPRLHRDTPVRLWATPALTQLEGDASERILQAVRDFFARESLFKSKSDWVTVMDGKRQAAYLWVTMNYLLENLGNSYADTVGVVHLGADSVQMAYAISELAAAKAAKNSGAANTYVQEMYLRGTKYALYAHSYLHYGLLAARAQILQASSRSGNPCILAGFDGFYRYGGKDYTSSGLSSGPSFGSCKVLARKVLNISKCKPFKGCSFDGKWNGGRGKGEKNLFATSFFFDRAVKVGSIDAVVDVANVSTDAFYRAACDACGTTFRDAKSRYPRVEADDLPYVCMDIVYQFVLLMEGFSIGHSRSITLVKRLQYQNFSVEPVWPLGSAVEAISAVL